MCFAAIAWARADRIFFAATREDAAAAGFADAELYRELALPADRRAIPATLLLREEGVLPFQAWAQSPRKFPY